MLAHSREKMGFVIGRGNRWQMLNRKQYIMVEKQMYSIPNLIKNLGTTHTRKFLCSLKSLSHVVVGKSGILPGKSMRSQKG